MSKKLFIANWKSHKNHEETVKFFDTVMDNIAQIDLTDKEIIIAPPFTLLAKAAYYVKKNNLPIHVAAQNVSSFPEGAYTGEVNALQVKEYAQYVIVGHSERRKYLHESESDIENKVREAKEQELIVVQCIQDENGIVYKGTDIVAYEPPSAIGTGNADDPQHISEVFLKVKEQYPAVKLLYGGSVSGENIKNFLEIDSLDGFLIGGAGLDADSFLSLLSW